MPDYVYFLRSDIGYTKIGTAGNVRYRCKTIESQLRNHPGPVVNVQIQGYVHGDREKEALYHGRLAKWRHRGEWFESAAVDRMIADYGIQLIVPGDDLDRALLELERVWRNRETQRVRDLLGVGT